MTLFLYRMTAKFLWKKKKRALLLAREKEIQNEKVEAVVKSMQRLTGILAEHYEVTPLRQKEKKSLSPGGSR